jgi:crotonobetainyl-CoA:carnitine CoA-transferase CaiB-like acyl-CoA transferase
MYHYLNLNKKSVKAIPSPQNFQEVLRNLDILIADFSNTERDTKYAKSIFRNMSDEALICSITAFGIDTQWASRPYSDFTIQALASYCSVNGVEGAPPLKEPGTETEFITGANAFTGLVSAIMHRDLTGVGQTLDTSVLHSTLSSYSPYLLAALYTGEPRKRQEQGLHFGLVPCRDGYVSMSVRHEPTWENLWIFFGEPEFSLDERFDSTARRRKNEEELKGILIPKLKEFSRQDLLLGLSPLRILVGPANSIEDLLRDGHLQERETFHHYNLGTQLTFPSNPIKMSQTPPKLDGSAPPIDDCNLSDHLRFQDLISNSAEITNGTSDNKKGPLSGLRATVLTQAWAGAYCTQLLGDLGMEVIQVESVTRLDPWRGGVPPYINGLYPNKEPGENPWERNALYNGVNRNKKGITLDLNDDECKLALMDLVSISDLFVENFSGRVIGNLGLGFDKLKQVNPSLVMMRMPTYGTYGPYANFPGNGGTTEPVAGMSYLMGYENGPPLNSGIMHTDAYSGILAAGASLIALRHRIRTGVGQCVELSQQDATISLLAEYIIEYGLTGASPGRQGNVQRNCSLQGSYLSSDEKWIAISIFDEMEWEEFCNIIGSDSLRRDARFIDAESRRQHRGSLDHIISELMVAYHSKTISKLLQNSGLACEIVLNTYEVMTNDIFKEMGLLEGLHQPHCGVYDQVKPPWEFSVTPAIIETSAPMLGQHTETVLTDIVGWAPERITSLYTSGKSGRTPTM